MIKPAFLLLCSLMFLAIPAVAKTPVIELEIRCATRRIITSG